MLARIRDRNIRLVYLAIFLLGTAYGISIAVTALFLDARGFSKTEIGQLAAIFASGIVVTSLPVGALLRRFSAKTTLTASLVGYAATVALFPRLPGFGAIALARFFDGAFSVGIWVSCETILLMRSDADNKAYVTSLYAVAIAVGYVVGPLAAQPIARAFSLGAAFFVAAVIAMAAAAVVATRLDPDPPGAHEQQATEDGPGADDAAKSVSLARASTSRLLARIKTSCFATFAYGYFQASVVLFLPLYLIESKGIARETTILVPAFFAAGMLLFSNAAGRVGDRVGHLLVMRVLGVIGLSMILGFVYLDTFPPMAAAVFVAGATLASISPVSLAFQGVVTPKHDYSRSNAIYNFCYAAGMLLGPPVSSLVFRRFGGAVMLYHLAAIWMAFVIFATVFAGDDPARARRLHRHLTRLTPRA
ncbi:MAG TPA: MFS transporter [Polyangiaceae bacterium]|nr:MFS transporter [Polyangiaceae bacterium]